MAKWTWRWFTEAGLRAWHAEKGAAGGKASKRGVDPDSFEQTEPWKREGVSRRTWYRRSACG